MWSRSQNWAGLSQPGKPARQIPAAHKLGQSPASGRTAARVARPPGWRTSRIVARSRMAPNKAVGSIPPPNTKAGGAAHLRRAGRLGSRCRYTGVVGVIGVLVGRLGGIVREPRRVGVRESASAASTDFSSAIDVHHRVLGRRGLSVTLAGAVGFSAGAGQSGVGDQCGQRVGAPLVDAARDRRRQTLRAVSSSAASISAASGRHRAGPTCS